MPRPRRTDDRRTRFLRSLALLSGVTAGACGGGAPTSAVPTAPSASATAVATTTGAPEAPPDAACRCSWDKDATAAPRVCKRGETAFDGRRCLASRPYEPGVVEGPLPPPSLGRARARKAARARPKRARAR